MDMIQEVRRQFADIPELKAALAVMKKNDGVDQKSWSTADQAVFDAADGKAEYGKCVEISTKASIREMVLPGVLAVASPVIIGFAGGPEMLGGLLAGVTSCGVLMAIVQSNAGGAWDNAKKMFEEGVEIQGKMYYKGSEPHKATVVGDTVGDPFKDTSLYDYTYSRFSKSIVLQKIIPLLNKKANYELDSIENVLIKDDPQRQEYKPTDAEDAKRLINQRYVERRTIDQSTPGKAKLPLTAPKPPEPDFDWSKLPVTSPFNMPGNFLLGQKYSHSVFLRAKITENLSVSDRVIRSKARAHLNKMLSKQMHSKVPPSHEWFNLDMSSMHLEHS